MLLIETPNYVSLLFVFNVTVVLAQIWFSKSEHFDWVGGSPHSVPIDLPIAVIAAHVSLHIGNVIVFWQIAVLLEIWTLMLGHGCNQVVDDLVRNKRVPEVEFSNIWLSKISIMTTSSTASFHSPFHQRLP